MKNVVKELREKYKLEIVSPFIFHINDEEIEFDCLIKGYGADKGMVIDSNWDKISPVESLLVELGYGYSCFPLSNSSVEVFPELLLDWGKTNT